MDFLWFGHYLYLDMSFEAKFFLLPRFRDFPFIEIPPFTFLSQVF